MLESKMSRYKELYQATQFPVFQNMMFKSEDEARNCTKGDIVLVQDLTSGLVFNQSFRPELMRYTADYQNEQAISSVFRQHLQSVSEIIQRHFHGASLIEVGCGKGHFLEHLQGLGFSVTGLDPTYEGTNPSVIKEYFSPELGLSAEGIVLRHVLEHVERPIEFLSKIRDANGFGGKIYIEVPCFDWICKHRAWFDVFYEHVNYFRLDDFYRMFDVVHEGGHTFGGQYLYVVADLASIRTPPFESVNPVSFPDNFLDKVQTYSSSLKSGKVSAIWGGASKGVIFALFMQRAGVKIDLVVDINPAKQGKYLPATGFRVHSAEEAIEKLPPGADIFVMNSNYLGEIVDLTRNSFNYLNVDFD